jgi:hypothetical protein
METIQLTTVLGIHAVNLAVPMLFEELERAGQPVPAPSTPRRKSTAGSGLKK